MPESACPDNDRDETDANYASMDQLLEALEHLGDELEARDPGDLTFQVTVREDLPSVGILSQLINQISKDWEKHIEAENAKQEKRSEELSKAYEALQSKNDEIQRDMEAARRIQLQLLPTEMEMPNREELDFAAFYQSKDKVGGDLYDLIRIGKNSYGLLVADVSGHGVPSALLTMFLKAAFRSRSRWGVGPAQICREVNTVLNPIVSDLGLFVTAFFGIIDLETGILHFCNCGHPSIFLHRSGEPAPLALGADGGMILGPFEEVELEENQQFLMDGDVLLAYTDGISEARNYLDQMFTEERLAAAFDQCVRRISGTQDLAAQVVTGLRKALTSFTMGAPADDDQTIAVLQFRHKITTDPHNARSDMEADRNRRHRALIFQLRKEAREAFQTGNYTLAENLIRSVLVLEEGKSFDDLLLALICYHTQRNDEAVNYTRAALNKVEKGSHQEKLALQLLKKMNQE